MKRKRPAGRIDYKHDPDEPWKLLATREDHIPIADAEAWLKEVALPDVRNAAGHFPYYRIRIYNSGAKRPIELYGFSIK